MANANSTRTPSVIVTKNDAKEALIRGPGGIRELAGIVQKFPATTNTERMDLGLTLRDSEPTPIGVPATAPQVTIAKVTGRTVTVRLRDSVNPDRRAKPEGVDGAAVLRYIGESAPADINLWTLAENTSRTTLDVDFPAALPIGAKVWFTAYWFNPRKQAGPACEPVSTHIGAGLAQAA